MYEHDTLHTLALFSLSLGLLAGLVGAGFALRRGDGAGFALRRGDGAGLRRGDGAGFALRRGDGAGLRRIAPLVVGLGLSVVGRLLNGGRATARRRS